VIVLLWGINVLLEKENILLELCFCDEFYCDESHVYILELAGNGCTP